MVTGFTGFDAQRRPFAACPDCGPIPLPLERKQMHASARAMLKEHNGIRHQGRKVPDVLPRRDLGLVDW